MTPIELLRLLTRLMCRIGGGGRSVLPWGLAAFTFCSENNIDLLQLSLALYVVVIRAAHAWIWAISWSRKLVLDAGTTQCTEFNRVSIQRCVAESVAGAEPLWMVSGWRAFFRRTTSLLTTRAPLSVSRHLVASVTQCRVPADLTNETLAISWLEPTEDKLNIFCTNYEFHWRTKVCNDTSHVSCFKLLIVNALLMSRQHRLVAICTLSSCLLTFTTANSPFAKTSRRSLCC